MSDCNAIERILLKYVYGNGLCPSSEEPVISLGSQMGIRNRVIPEVFNPRLKELGDESDFKQTISPIKTFGDDRKRFLADIKLLAESTATLSKLFTKERDNLPSDYLKDNNLRNAYILYFLQANLYKIHNPLRELSLHPVNLFQKDRLRVLDVGSGPGTAILGILDFFAKCDKKPFLEFVAVDSVAENLRDAEGLFKLYMNETSMSGALTKEDEIEWDKNVPPILDIYLDRRGFLTPPEGFSDAHYSGCSLTTIKSSIEKIKKLPHESFDLIVISNLLSEVAHNDPDRIAKRVAILKRLLNDFMSDDGSCIIIEPALRETSRDMLHVRDRMLEEGFHIYSPCLMNKHCPALDNPKDWCHEDIPWNPTELIQKIDSLTGLRKDSIKFSYLVIRKDTLSIADLYKETPTEITPPLNPLPQGEGRLEEQFTEWGQGEFLNSLPFKGRVRVGMGLFSDEYSYRIVSEPLISKGKIEFYVCGSSGRNLVVRLDKDRSPLNKVYDELKRGDVISCRGLIDEGKRLKVNQETDIEILERHRLNI